MKHFISAEKIERDYPSYSWYKPKDDIKKLSFKTLDNKIVNFNGRFEVITLADYESNLFKMKCFKESNEIFALDVYSFILVKGKPIWGVASHTRPNHKSIFPNPNWLYSPIAENEEEKVNYYIELENIELNYVDYYTREYIVPTIYQYCNYYCQNLDNTKNHIIDVRKFYYYFTVLHGAFVPPDITHTLPDNDVRWITIYKEIVSDFPDAVKKQKEFNRIAELLNEY